eukprot:15458632-Alexandrium_andersonii.AAC.1
MRKTQHCCMRSKCQLRGPGNDLEIGPRSSRRVRLSVPSAAIANRSDRAQSQRHCGYPAYGSAGAGKRDPIAIAAT